jgi:serine/threonine-protein kinase
MFIHEAKLAVRLSHANVVQVFDLGIAPGTVVGGLPSADAYYMAMEYVSGLDLATLLTRCRRQSVQIPVEMAVYVAAEVAKGLDHAHRRRDEQNQPLNIVHLDVSPQNVLLSLEGEVKVTDFGIARSLSDASLTQTGTVMGTAHYSAPEQVRGESASPASDIYSMGVVLYEMLTGERPYSGDTPIAVAMARLSEDPPHPKELRSAIPAALDAVVMRALAREPGDRFASAAEMRAALDKGAVEAPIDQTQVLAIEGADETMALRGLIPEEPKESRIAAAVPPAWAGKRVAKLLVPLIVVALLVWGLVAAVGGPTTTKIPDFQGMSLNAAEQLAARAHLKLNVNSAPSDIVPKGSIIRQSPTPSNAAVTNGTTVTVTVSSGPRPCCTLPSLFGMNIGDAQSAVTNLGLNMGVVTYSPSSQPADTVIGQVPGANAHVKPGDYVDLTVSTGPPGQGNGNGKGHGD